MVTKFFLERSSRMGAYFPGTFLDFLHAEYLRERCMFYVGLMGLRVAASQRKDDQIFFPHKKGCAFSVSACSGVWVITVLSVFLGRKPLIVAAAKGSTSCMSLVLSAGAEVNARDAQGKRLNTKCLSH